jgi:hypothetical protein
MSRDEVVALLLVASFAGWGTLYVVIAAKLVLTPPRWRGIAALFVPPLAPYWATRTGRHPLAVLWVVLGLTWLVTRLALAK